MAKIIEYPRASLRSSLQLAEAVDSFAGSCSPELAAEKLGKKLSGSFSALIGACVKYRLISSKFGKLSITPTYREYKLAYTPEEAAVHLRAAFLSPPLFRSIHDRFKNQLLPVQHFQKLLVREFDVPEPIASRIVIYFLDGAKQCNLLGADNLLLEQISEDSSERGDQDEGISVAGATAFSGGGTATKEEGDSALDDSSGNSPLRNSGALPLNKNSRNFDVSFQGPGINISLEIAELDDLELVNVMLRKIEKALKQREKM